MNERHLTGGLLSIAFGAVVLVVGVWLANYDIGHGHIGWATFSVAIVGVAILVAGVGALRGKNYWPYVTLVGSTLIFAVACAAGKGNPFIFFTRAYAPIGFFGVLAPVLIAAYSVQVIIRMKGKTK